MVQALALPEMDGDLRNQCLHLLYKLCQTCELLPTTYVLQQKLTRVGTIHRYGGFADVCEGEYLERRVAIKQLRLWDKDEFDKVFKVLEL